MDNYTTVDCLSFFDSDVTCLLIHLFIYLLIYLLTYSIIQLFNYLNLNFLAGEFAEADIAIIVDDVINHPPQFLQKTYIASLEENALEGTALKFVGGFDRVQDFDKVHEKQILIIFSNIKQG